MRPYSRIFAFANAGAWNFERGIQPHEHADVHTTQCPKRRPYGGQCRVRQTVRFANSRAPSPIRAETGVVEKSRYAGKASVHLFPAVVSKRRYTSWPRRQRSMTS